MSTTLRRQGLAKLHRHFQAGSVPAFHNSQKNSVYRLCDYNPEAEMSRKIVNSQKNPVCIAQNRRHFFVAFQSFYALESSIVKKRRNVFRIGASLQRLRPKYDTSDRIEHRIIQLNIKKNPEFSRKCCNSQEKYVYHTHGLRLTSIISVDCS
jgi:hypothetical protein